MNPALPTHPFNPGNIGDASGTESTFGIMYAGGYVYHGTGYGDLSAYWTKDGVRLPAWKYYTPTAEVAPTSAQHGARIAEEWHKCGFNNIAHEPMDFNTYTSLVFDDHNFDIYMIFWSLGRFPTQLYDMCDSSQYVSGSSQPVGLNDPVLDKEVETVKYSLNRTEQIEAAWAAQEHLYNPANAQALCYMLMYSRVYFNGARSDLTGVINSPGYSSDNWATWLNWNKAGGTVIYCNGEEPQTLNYLAQSTAYEAAIIGPEVDALINVDPYQHRDLAWQADSWVIQGPVNVTTPGGISIVNGMEVTFHINDKVYWQDGNKFTAAEAKFSLDFLRTKQIPNFLSATKDIAEVYVDPTDPKGLTFTVYSRKTSPFFAYDWAGSANVCPSAVWKGFQSRSLSAILSYDLTANGTNTGPWSGNAVTDPGPSTLLFGTGPYVFEKYDPTGMYADLHAWRADVATGNLGYFKSTTEIADTFTNLFHTTGDIDKSGAVWASDKNIFGLNFGKPATAYPDADLNGDGTIDWSDGAIVGAFFGWKKQYPSTLV